MRGIRRCLQTNKLKMLLCLALTILIMLTGASCADSSIQTMAGENNQAEQTELLVIMYHHMTQSQKYVNDYNIHVSQFERDLMYLKENGYQTVTTQQLFSYIYAGKPLPSKSCMITFDDGFRSVYVYAYPLLKQYDMTAIVNIIGSCADTASQTEDNNVLYAYLSWEEIIELDNSGVFEIGNHTYDMHKVKDDDSQRTGCVIMKNESEQQYREIFNRDVGGLQDIFFERLGYYPYIFAYPYGSKCSQAQDMLKEMSFKIVFTCTERINKLNQSGEDMLSLDRFNRSGKVTSEQFFKAFLK